MYCSGDPYGLRFNSIIEANVKCKNDPHCKAFYYDDRILMYILCMKKVTYIQSSESSIVYMKKTKGMFKRNYIIVSTILLLMPDIYCQVY